MSHIEELEPYLRALLEENQRLNLTGIRDLDQARVLHVRDSLAIEVLGLTPRHCLDLGTGNGFPGVALRVLYPDAEVTLLDRTAKKLDAIGRVLQRAPLSPRSPRMERVHADAAHAARTHPELAGRFDLIAARAVADPAKVARLAAALTAPAGRLVLWLDADAEPAGRLVVATAPDFELEVVQDYELPEPARRQRKLACYRR